MTEIPVALVGVEHPHRKDWHDTLARVPELVPVAHYDPNPNAARTALEAPYDQLPVYGDLSELLARHQVQAALVLLSLRDAEEAMVTLAQAGVHMMAEKPVARTAAGLQRVASVLRPGTLLYSGYCWRYDPIIRHFRSLVESGILGQLWSIEMRWVTSQVGRRPGVPAHRNPDSYLFSAELSRGGMLQWLGSHWLDLMLYITQQPVAAVAAMTARQTTDEIEVEDTATCLLRFGNGMLGSLHVGYLLPTGGQAFMGLRGSLGWLHWDWQDQRRFTVHSTHPDWAAAPTRVFDFPSPPNATYGGGTGEALLRDFARCIRDNGARPRLTVADAMEVLRICDAAYAAADSGRTVQIS